MVLGEPFLLIDGVLQNQDGVISVKADRVSRAAGRRGAGVARFSLRSHQVQLTLPHGRGIRATRDQRSARIPRPSTCNEEAVDTTVRIDGDVDDDGVSLMIGNSVYPRSSKPIAIGAHSLENRPPSPVWIDLP